MAEGQMPNEPGEEILDFPRRKHSAEWQLKLLYYLAFPLLAYWIMGDWLYWPHRVEALFAGLALLALITVLGFFRNPGPLRPKPYEWFYFFGRLTLISAIFARFIGSDFDILLISMALALFTLGLLFLWLQKEPS